MKMNKVPLISFLSLVLLSTNVLAQTNDSTSVDSAKKDLPDNWFNLDPKNDNIQGISTNKTYVELLKGMKSSTVVVAVIDSGIDTEHEDLIGSIWINKDEIVGNSIDDDHNGYIDDINGWNFLGNNKGENISSDSYELTREYVRLSGKFDGKKKIKKKDQIEYQYYEQVKKEFDRQKAEAEEQYIFFSNIKKSFELVNSFFEEFFKGSPYSVSDIRSIETEDQMILQAKQFMIMAYDNGINNEVLKEEEERLEKTLNYAFNLDYDPRSLVGDDYSKLSEKGYGNNDVKGPDASHGTHVAGIIGANRINDIGIKGIADNVQIMVIRAVPDGDERDKDIANAIYYAVDNGAKIVNMSFGKSYSPNKDIIDKAVKHAEKQGVLLIHAAGNSSKNIDVKNNFPNKNFQDGNSYAKNWIEVGASSAYLGKELVGTFSNYGQNNVDVFAPGVAITSTTPDQTYEAFDGTSMSAPATTGLAALLLSYFPSLSLAELTNIILTSGVNHGSEEVILPAIKDKEKIIRFEELSKSGTIINCYNAVELAISIVQEEK